MGFFMMHVNVTLNTFVRFFFMGVEDTHCLSVARGLSIKWILFSGSVWNGGMFHKYKSGQGFNNICLEMGCMPIWKGLINYEEHAYTCIFKGSQSWLGTETLLVHRYSF